MKHSSTLRYRLYKNTDDNKSINLKMQAMMVIARDETVNLNTEGDAESDRQKQMESLTLWNSTLSDYPNKSAA